MASYKDINKSNISSITTTDPSTQSFPSKKLTKNHTNWRSPKKIPHNTPRTNSTASVIYNENISIPGLIIPKNLSPLHINEINNFRKKKIEEYKETLETLLNYSLPVIYK